MQIPNMYIFWFPDLLKYLKNNWLSLSQIAANVLSMRINFPKANFHGNDQHLHIQYQSPILIKYANIYSIKEITIKN
jgi:hypothetical protein